MKLSYLALSLGLLCLGGPVSAAETPQATQSATSSATDTSQQQTTSGQQQQSAADQSNQEEKICKREPISGSKLGVKVCKTKKEWDEQAKGNSADF